MAFSTTVSWNVTPSAATQLTQPQGTFSQTVSRVRQSVSVAVPPPKNSAFPGPVLVITYDPAEWREGVDAGVYLELRRGAAVDE